MAYELMGWLSVWTLAVMLMPYLLRFANNRFFHWKGKTYNKILKGLRTVHKPLGAVLLVAIAVHGTLALGGLRLHTGSILGSSLFITATLGVLFHLYKKKALFLWHKRMAAVTVLLFAVHFFFPSAVYRLFGM